MPALGFAPALARRDCGREGTRRTPRACASVRMESERDGKPENKPCVLQNLDVSNFSSRARLAVYHFDLERVVEIVPPAADRRSKEYRENMHPFGKFPVLLVRDAEGGTECIFETEVIVRYLIERFAMVNDPVPRAEGDGNALLRAKCDMYVRLHDTYASPHQAALYRAGFSLDERQAALESMDEVLGALEHRLAADVSRGSRAGPLLQISGAPDSALSRADIAWFPTLVYLEYIGLRWLGRCILDSDGRKHVLAWFRWMKTTQPAGQRVHAEMWAALRKWDEGGRWANLGLEPRAPARQL